MFYVYIMASGRNGTLYIGQTGDLNSRVYGHQVGVPSGFTSKYGVKMLVYYEFFETREAAFKRERVLKKWDRLWKIRLIERFNPEWRDLALELQP
jgi:putative endonuclease